MVLHIHIYSPSPSTQKILINQLFLEVEMEPPHSVILLNLVNRFTWEYLYHIRQMRLENLYNSTDQYSNDFLSFGLNKEMDTWHCDGNRPTKLPFDYQEMPVKEILSFLGLSVGLYPSLLLV